MQSIFCDLAFFLCYSELNPNLWTSEDVITPEPRCYDNSDEQVSTLPTSKEAALGSQTIKAHDPKMKDQKRCNVGVHFARSFQGGTQCKVKDDCSQTKPKQYGCEDELRHSPEILKLSSTISVRDFSLSLSESDQAETDFNELYNEFSYATQHGDTDTDKTIVKRISDPITEDHQATLAMIEDDTDTDITPKSKLSKCDEVTAQFIKISYGNDKVSCVDTSFQHFKSSKKENAKHPVRSDVYPDNVPFIDDSDDVQFQQLKTAL